ncbi:MAG: helix-turn-helix domain-containing protein [Lachnospiraceae bacterium]|nr:helix-turn-helix domain-containing protein [Lachnospiraceae bacterium]
MDLHHEWSHKELSEQESGLTHRPMEDEYAFYNAVKNGDLNDVIANCESGAFEKLQGAGQLSRNALTNIKYHFVITTALVTRHCVEGGMALELAYRLSDFYIQKLDDCNTIENVITLHQTMVLDYTTKMQQLKKNAILSKAIVLCTDYIYKNLNKRITLRDLAEYSKLSEGHLSRLFKKNLGKSVSDYIREKKVEKAENLLKYSDYSYIEITNYLAFSSQSHFIHVFEKQVGMTPKQYRDRFYRSTW